MNGLLEQHVFDIYLARLNEIGTVLQLSLIVLILRAAELLIAVLVFRTSFNEIPKVSIIVSN